MTATARRLVVRATRPAGTRLRVRASTAASRCRTRAALAAGRRRTARAGCSTPRARLERRRLARAGGGAGRSAACSTSCTSARSRRRARSTPRSRAWTTSSTLGVDVVELMPVAAFPGRRGWGYDGVDLYAVHEPYGGPAALQRFVDACHARGLGVCLDVVYNHLGPERELPARVRARTSPTATTRPWGEAVNLDDEGAAEVRRWIVRQRAALVRGLPRRRAAAGRRPRARRRLAAGTCWRAVRRGRALAAPARPAAGAGRGERPQRPGDGRRRPPRAAAG